MKNLKSLNKTAHIAVTPFVTTFPVRTDAAMRYPQPLEELHTYAPDIIAAVIKQYNKHLDQFLGAIEDPRQAHTIKIPLLKFPIQKGISAIAASSFLQRNAGNSAALSIKDYLNSSFSLAANAPTTADPDSIVHHVQTLIDFDQLLERLCRVVENKQEVIPVRDTAIEVISSLCTQASYSFGLNLDRDRLNRRMLGVGLSSTHRRLTKSAIQFADGVNPIAARIPS